MDQGGDCLRQGNNRPYALRLQVVSQTLVMPRRCRQQGYAQHTQPYYWHGQRQVSSSEHRIGNVHGQAANNSCRVLVACPPHDPTGWHDHTTHEDLREPQVL